MKLTNTITNNWIDAFINHPTSALLIDCFGDGEAGYEIAQYICAKLSENEHTPTVTLDAQDKKSVGIEDVRFLRKSLLLKANKQGDYTRFITINDASLLTQEAQNSLLKLMEELPNKTVLIIVCDNIKNLLETVKSRCFIIPVLPITEKQAIQYGEFNGHSVSESKKAYILSDGFATRYIRLLNGELSSLYELIEVAKKFISDSIFERQIFLQSLVNTKSIYTYDDFISALKLTAKSGMRFATTSEKKMKWKTILQSIVIADEQVDSNVSEKLALLSLSVSI